MKTLVSAVACCCVAISTLCSQDFGQSPINRTLDSRRMNFGVIPVITVRYIMMENDPSFVDFGYGATLAFDLSLESDNTLNAGYMYLLGISFHSGGYTSNFVSNQSWRQRTYKISDVSYTSTRVLVGAMYSRQGAASEFGFQGKIQLDIEFFSGMTSGSYTSEFGPGGTFNEPSEGNTGTIALGAGINKYYQVGGIVLIPGIMAEVGFGRSMDFFGKDYDYEATSIPVIPTISFLMQARF